jgi:hypothetical protein
MGKCAEPGEPGFDEGLAAGLLLRVALRIMAETGPGLPLVNGLRDRFPGATQEQLGRYATWAGDAVAAADAFNNADAGAVLPVEAAPVVAGSGLWQENPMSQVQAAVEATGVGEDGEPMTFTFTVFTEPGWTKADFDKAVEDYIKEDPPKESKTDPRAILRLISTKVWYVTAQW